MQGWLYLAVIIDLLSRKVVGRAMSDRLKATLVKDAFTMAYFQRKAAKGLIHDSDRGSRYASGDHQKQLGTYGMVCSMT